MSDWISRLFEPIKEIFPFIKSHYLAITLFLAILTWSLILLPATTLDFLRIDKPRNEYFSFLGFAAFLTTSFLVFRLFYQIYVIFNRKYSNDKENQQRQVLIHSLTPTEYVYLKKYIENRSHTATFTIFDGVVAGLVEKGILYKASSQANRAGEQDFNIYPWAYEYLRSRPDLLRNDSK